MAGKKTKKTKKVRAPRRTVRDLVPGYDQLEGVVTDAHGWLKRLTPQQYADALREIEALERKSGGVTPDMIVEAARPKSSALHDCFTWDDKMAAALYRNSEARRVLRGFVFVPTDADLKLEIPYFTNVRTSEPVEGPRGGQDTGTRDDAYVVIKEVANREYMMADMVERGMRRLLTFRTKFGYLTRFQKVVAAIDKLEAELNEEKRDETG
jgi:hypothetical protein